MRPEENIELRSEKARSLIGKMLPFHTLYGTLILSIAILLLFGVLRIVEITEYKSCEVTIVSTPEKYQYYSKEGSYITYSYQSGQSINKGDAICEVYDSINDESAILHTPFNGTVEYYVLNKSLSDEGQMIVAVTPSDIETISAVAEVAYQDFLDIHDGQHTLVYLQNSTSPIDATVSSVVELGDNMLIFVEMNNIHEVTLDSVNRKAKASFFISKEPLLKKILPILFKKETGEI